MSLLILSYLQKGLSCIQDVPDSICSIDNIYEYTFSDYDKARQIASILRSRSYRPKYKLDIAEGDLYFNNGSYYRALDYYRQALEAKEVFRNDTLYMEQLHRIISCYDCLQRTDKLTHYVELLFDKAVSCGDEAMKSVALFNMGKTLYNQGLKDKGYKYMNEAIDIMELSEYKYKYDNLRYNYNVLLVFQGRDKDYESKLHTLAKLENIVSATTNEEEHDMQQLFEKEMKSVYAHRAIVLNRLGKSEEAERNYELFLSLSDVFPRDNYLIMPYLFDKGRYDDIINMNRKRETAYRLAGDTVSYHMRTIKRSLANAYAAKGDWKTASELYFQYAQLADSIKEREQKSASLELAAVYDLYMKDTELLEQKASLRVRLIVITFLIFGLLLLWFYSVRMKAKNKLLVAKLDEMVTLEEKLQNLKGNGSQNGTVDISPNTTSEHDRRQENRKLFEKMDLEIHSRKLYLQPELGRDELAAIIGVDKNRFAEIIRDNTEGRLNDYLNKMRIIHAIRIMKEKNHYTLHGIALESGFINMSTFNNAFKRYTGLTPSHYREVKIQ